jgi:hypothetical protein
MYLSERVDRDSEVTCSQTTKINGLGNCRSWRIRRRFDHSNFGAEAYSSDWVGDFGWYDNLR